MVDWLAGCGRISRVLPFVMSMSISSHSCNLIALRNPARLAACALHTARASLAVQMPHSIMASALGLLLVFRSNAAYDRCEVSILVKHQCLSSISAERVHCCHYSFNLCVCAPSSNGVCYDFQRASA
jgi:hypothetical protein